MTGYNLIVEHNVEKITNIVYDSYEQWVAMLDLLRKNKYRDSALNVLTLCNAYNLCYHIHIRDFDNIEYLYSFKFYENIRNVLGMRWVHLWDLPLHTPTIHGCGDTYELNFKYPELLQQGKGFVVCTYTGFVEYRMNNNIKEHCKKISLPWCEVSGREAYSTCTLHVEDENISNVFSTLTESYNCLAYETNKSCFQLSAVNGEVDLVVII